jgi:hypothetical protein
MTKKHNILNINKIAKLWPNDRQNIANYGKKAIANKAKLRTSYKYITQI